MFTHLFARLSHEKSNCKKQLLFSVIFALRRVILLYSDIRLFAEWHSLRECVCEYNITVPGKAGHFTFLGRRTTNFASIAP